MIQRISLTIIKNPKVHQYILTNPPTNRQQAAGEILHCSNLFYKSKGFFFAIATRQDKKMIGSVGLYINPRQPKAELSYDLSEAYWNQKIMTKTLRRVIEFATNTLDLGRIECYSLKQNTASIKLLERLNFQHEGTLKNYRYFNGRYHTLELYAITSASSH